MQNTSQARDYRSVTVPELLAPAGDWEALRAAVANGADAVYFGLGNFNARHRATNFRREELGEVMRYLHAHNVKGYLTFNTLIFSEELAEAEAWIAEIAQAGVDAVIVQDLGLAKLIAHAAPALEVHGSTQMTLMDSRGIEFAHALGIKRVILARELSLADIRKLKTGTAVPVEVFVHGALCVAYSGQCLTSESLGGRSANRGQCAQACRLPYELIVDGVMKDLGDKAYLLSPQDLAGYDLIAQLVEAGVHSFKIEGRLKSAHYVAATTQTYRAAIDAALHAAPFRIAPQQKLDLEQSFSRGFTPGFLAGVNHQQLVQGRFPKARGTRIGTIARKTLGGLIVALADRTVTLKPGDGVVFDEGHPEQDEQGGRVFVVKPAGPGQVEIELGRGDVNLAAVAIGALVWKTDDPASRKRLEHSFSRDTVLRRVAVTAAVQAMIGQPLRVSLSDGSHTATAQADGVLEQARKFAVTEEGVREQLGRLGDTPFELATVTLQTDGAMVPKSLLNDLRRRACDDLLQQREHRTVTITPNALDALRAQVPVSQGANPSPESHESHLHILVRTLDQLEAVLAWQPAVGGVRRGTIYCDFEDVRRYAQAVDRCRAAGAPIALATVRIIKPGEEGLLKQILDCQPDAVLIRNLAGLSYFGDKGVPMLGDYSLNVANELTAAILTGAGLQRLVPSYDLNFRQMQAMIARGSAAAFEVVVHQHMPMFHMEHCVFAHTLSNGKDCHDCGRPCDHHALDLRDRVGIRHPLIPDVGCRNTVFNGEAQSAMTYIPEIKELGIRHFRVELLRESAAEVPGVLVRYAQVIAGLEEPQAAVHGLRVLNQLGVIPGTLGRE